MGASNSVTVTKPKAYIALLPTPAPEKAALDGLYSDPHRNQLMHFDAVVQVFALLPAKSFTREE